MKMPALGESVTEGTVTRWLKQVGDTVEADEPLLEVSTDKVDTEIPSPVAGTVLEIKVAEDETAAGRRRPRPHRRGRCRGPGRAAAARAGPGTGCPSAGPSRAGRPGARGTGRRAGARAAAAAPPAPRRRRPPPPAPAPAPPPHAADGDSDGYVTPLVRKLAAEHGVDLAALTGTGVGGRIRKQDVLDAAAKAKAARRPPPAPAPPRRPPAQGRAEPAARPHREAVPPARRHRQADGRVAAGLGPADHGGRGRRHPHRQAARRRPRPTSRPATA